MAPQFHSHPGIFLAWKALLCLPDPEPLLPAPLR